jgi:aryl-phospho-beta-D-glucosidase BglC (GH1 family)
MKRLITATVLFLIFTLTLEGCKEHFSDGERVGTVTKFSKAGVIWDSWDGDLNLTQTGMNSAGEPFSFSFDNDRSDQDSLIELVNEAQRYGWKIKIVYHQVWGLKNVLNNRGENDYFVDNVIVLDKTFAKPLGDITKKDTVLQIGTIDNPLYVVIMEKNTNKDESNR